MTVKVTTYYTHAWDDFTQALKKLVEYMHCMRLSMGYTGLCKETDSETAYVLFSRLHRRQNSARDQARTLVKPR